MLSEEQIEEITELINLKQEGQYWDFKKEWYKSDKKQDLLHDIICMANNLENRDAYIIIGIDEENDYQVNDMSISEERYNTQKLVDFLRNKKFAGGIRPRVMVETMIFESASIDIIVIKNGYYTPYVLEDNYRGVNANNIYTRVMDCNTPKNKTAEILHIEYLWKKRFHLLTTPLDQVFYYLLKKEEWLDVEDDSETSQYYKYFPEYTIELSRCDDRNGYEYYLFSQMDSRPKWYNIYVKYHQTVLFSTVGVGLDGGRFITNIPCTEFLFDEISSEDNAYFKYYVNGSKEMVLYEFYFDNNSYEARHARDRFEECILIFKSDEEKEEFKKYASSKWSEKDKYLEDIKLPHIELPKDYCKDAFKEDYRNAIVLKKMLDEYRAV